MLNAPRNIDSPIQNWFKASYKAWYWPNMEENMMKTPSIIFGTCSQHVCLLVYLRFFFQTNQPCPQQETLKLPVTLPHGPLVQSLLRMTRIFNIWLWLKTRGSTKMNLPITEYDPSFLVSLCLPSFGSYFWQTWPHLHGVALDFELERLFP